MDFALSLVAYSTSFVALVVASISDLKKREVPDWLSYGLIIFGFGLNAIYALVFRNLLIILYSIAGFVLFLIFAYMMFYGGQWGGGDSKILMGLGALLGLSFLGFNFLDIRNLPFLLNFFINLLIVSIFYGFFWSILLAAKNREPFLKKFSGYLRKFVVERRIVLALSAIALVGFIFVDDFYLKLILLSASAIIFFSFYLWVFAKAVEEGCMLKFVEPERLTEGDWIAEEIKVDGKYVSGPKDLGIEKEQIKKLIALKRKGKIKKVLIKEGIPFIPSFLIAFVLSLIIGNVVGYFII